MKTSVFSDDVDVRSIVGISALMRVRVSGGPVNATAFVVGIHLAFCKVLRSIGLASPVS